MTISNQLVVPITLWGSQAPTHCISCIYFTRDQKTIVTGCNDGQICVWDVKEHLKIVPRCLLFGHTAPVLCLIHGSIAADSTLLVSSSEAGEMSLWDLTDGRCLENAKLPYVHTSIQAYNMFGTNDVRLFCNGYYAEILVMDVLTLDILFTLSSRVYPNWISAMHVLRPVKKQYDVVVGLSASGMLKVWSLFGSESKSEPIYEGESKPIKCFNALKLTCCAYNQRTILIVCTTYWQIYDAGDFSLLCSSENPRNERWIGGDFTAADKVLVWSDGGKGYLYKLPTNCIFDSKDFHSASKISDQPFLFHTLVVPRDKKLLCPPAMNYFLTTRGHFQKLLFRGDSSGRVVIWSVPDVADEAIQQVKAQNQSKPVELNPEATLCLQEAWDTMHPSPPGILDQMHITVVGTDDTTTCSMVVVRHSGSGVSCLAHFDGSGLEQGVVNVVRLVQDLSMNVPEGRLELHLVGGFLDPRGYSEELAMQLLYTLHKQPFSIHLMTACICELNNSLRGNINWPVIYGIGVNTKNGEIFPATFPDKGPDFPLRSARYFTGCYEMLDIYDCNLGMLRIGPYNYEPLRGVDLWLSQSDDFILRHLSTSPEVEPPSFVVQVRATLKYIQQNPFPGITVFPDNRPHFFQKDESGSWIRVCY